MAVEKKLHFVWVGDESKRPDGCIDSWRRLNPEFEVRVWGNDDFRRFPWVNKKHMEDMWDHELCGVADLMRYEILYAQGGIALDADSFCVRPLEEWVIEPDDFTCWSSDLFLGQLLANGIMGAKRHSPYVAAVIQEIRNKETVIDDRAWITTGPVVTTNVWQKLHYPLTVWPSHMFLPDFHSGPDYDGAGPVFARQFYGSTRNGMGGEDDIYASISQVGADAGEGKDKFTAMQLL